MSDPGLRAAERAWHAHPEDLKSGQAYLLACERGKVDPPLDLLFSRMHEARAVQLPPEVVSVHLEHPRGQLFPVEHATRATPLEVPEHRDLSIQIKAQSWAQLAACLTDLFRQLDGSSLRLTLDMSELSPAGQLPKLGSAHLHHLETFCQNQEHLLEEPALLPALRDVTFRSLEVRGPVPEEMPTVRDRLTLKGDGELAREDLLRIRRASPTLRELRLRVTCSPQAFAGLPAFTHLERLGVCREHPYETEEGQTLGLLPRLRHLSVFGGATAPFRFGVFAELAESLKLETLSLTTHARVAPKMLREVGLHSHLESLQVYVGEGLRDVSTKGWERLTRLRKFFLEDASRQSMTPYGLHFLSLLPELRTLFFNAHWLNDGHIFAMARAWPPKLESLTLRHAFGMTEASVPHLRTLLPQLQYLWLNDTGIPWKICEQLHSEVPETL